MQRRDFVRASVTLPVAVGVVSIAGGLLAVRYTSAQNAHADSATAASGFGGKLEKTAREWQQLLGRERYAVLFQEATEPSGSSPLNTEKRAGTFVCAACYLPLFDSSAKYESGTGWPSFFQPLKPEQLGTRRDYRMIIPRTEYHCARCGGHQGHVFTDGPRPTGLRYCNNGLALRFVPAGQSLPVLRV